MKGVETVLRLRTKYAEPKKTLTDPAKYYDTSFIERAMKEHPEWFNDLPGER